MTDFEKWYDELVNLAKGEKLLWIISNNPEDHREGYDMGYSPEDELDEQKDAAS